MSVLSSPAKMQFFDITGAPLVGGLLYTYAAGTTTPLTTYTDSSNTSLNSNPVVLNARGEANVWLGADTYKFKLCDSNNVEIWTVDNISAPTTALSPVLSGNVTINSSSSNPALTITQTGTGAVLRAQDSTNPDASPFIIDTYGNVGIQNATPSAALDIGNSGDIVISNSGTIQAIVSAEPVAVYISAPGAGRGVVILTDNTPRLVINDTNISALVPIGIPNLPTVSYEATNKQYVDSVGTTSSPPGIIAPFAGLTPPTGWLTCDGSAVSRTTYAALFAAISTTWGAGNGTTTFNVPDLRGMFVRGTGTNGTVGGAIGPAIGASQTDTYLNHNHSTTDPTHTHDVGVVVGVNGGGAGSVPYPQTGSGTVVTSNASSTGISVNTSTTGGTETRPKNYGVLYIIKT
jgi:microcystin-dependent protein